MQKVLCTLLIIFLVSSFGFAEMKLKLRSDLASPQPQTIFDNNLETNLKLDLPPSLATSPNSEFLKMWLVGVFADLSIPTGDLGDAYSTGFSGHAMFGYMIARSVLLNLSIGYTSFSEKESIEDADISFSWVPLLLGVNYVFNPGKKFMPFVGAAIGLFFISQSFSYSFFGQSYDESVTSTEFGVVPRVGAYYLASASVLLALSLEYNIIFTEGSSSSALGILFGAMFAFH
jgi:outer membrane protein W